MAEEMSKDTASKADHEPTAKTEQPAGKPAKAEPETTDKPVAKAEDSPKTEQPVGKPAKVEPETKDKAVAKAEGSPKAKKLAGKPAKAKPKIKDKPEAKTAATVAVKSEGPATSTSQKPAPDGPATTASEKKSSEPAFAAISGGTKNAAARPGAGPSSASGGGSWALSRAAAWVPVVILGLVIVIGFPLLIDSHGDKIADLRAELDAERRAIAAYPNAAAALEAIRTEQADVVARLVATKAEADALAARRVEAEEQLTALDERFEAQGGEIEAQIAALKGERNRLDGLVRATGDDLQAAMALIEAARGRMSQ
jgi:hypothetical protein